MPLLVTEFSSARHSATERLMDKSSGPLEFYGVPDRVVASDGDIKLRVYPFTFSTKPDEKAVLVVRFEAAAFGEPEISGMVGGRGRGRRLS